MNKGPSETRISSVQQPLRAPKGVPSHLMRQVRNLSLAAIGLTGLAAAHGCNSDKLMPDDACLKGSVLCPGGTGATGGTNEGGTGTGGHGTAGTGLNEGGTAGAGGNGTGGTGLNEGGTAGAGGNGTGGTGLNEGGTAGSGGNGTGGTGLNEGGTAGTGGNGTGGSGGENVGGNGSGGEGGGQVGDNCVNHYSCEGELLCCNNVCIEQSTQNCGNCGVTCTGGTPFCIPSTMTCEAGCYGIYSDCGEGLCRNTDTDPNHCGGCWNDCGQGNSCTNGHCVNN